MTSAVAIKLLEGIERGLCGKLALSLLSLLWRRDWRRGADRYAERATGQLFRLAGSVPACDDFFEGRSRFPRHLPLSGFCTGRSDVLSTIEATCTMELETETILVRIATKEASTIRPPSNAPAARASDRVGEFAGALKPCTVELLTIREQRANPLWVYTIFPQSSPPAGTIFRPWGSLVYNFTASALRFQVSWQYSAMARSDENLPLYALLMIDIRVHFSASSQAASTCCWQAM